MSKDKLQDVIELPEQEFFTNSAFWMLNSVESLVSGKITSEEFYKRKMVLDGFYEYRKIVNSIPKYPSKGWLFPYLLMGSSLFDKRWDWWLSCIDKNELIGKIPRIGFFHSVHESPVQDTLKNLENCVKHLVSKGYGSNSLNYFVDWILWGLGGRFSEQPIKLDEKASRWLYENFQLGLLQKAPFDYWGYLASEEKGNGKWRNPTAFFPTPHSVVSMTIKMLLADVKEQNFSLCDPCAGTGIILMEASNYTVDLYAQEIDLTICKMLEVNAFLYMPSVVVPKKFNCLSNSVKMVVNNDKTVQSTFGF